VYRDGFLVRVEHNDLDQATGSISADHQHPILALEHEAQRDAQRGTNILVGDSVSSSTVLNLHH
jgi:hypothetical protein